MSAFTEKEIEYLNEQRLGRLATVDAEGRPHVVPVAFRYNAKLDAVDIGGHNFAGSKKFRDAGKTGKAAFVVDDVLPPWRVRGVEVRGRAEIHSEGGKEIMEDFAEELIRILPRRIVGWGIDSDAFSQNARSVG
ncbi:MAG TPA: PPOX class F420-dependent oxidoreductase [Rubrobacter sp.]|jgi:pyridoxamine 5'-phosphate oxidase family protein